MGVLLVVLVAGQLATPATAAVEEAALRLGSVEVLVLLSGGTPGGLVEELGAGEVTVLREYPALGGVFARVAAPAVPRLLASPLVRAVQLEATGTAATAESAVAIGADVVHRELGRTGAGVTVAVLDTGVDRDHGDLDGGLVGEKCFVLGGCDADGGSESDQAPEGSGHGTHVIGIITGDGVVAPRGIAPDARVVAIRVFNGASIGRVSDWVAALDWVLASREALGIRVVNMSLGTDATYSGACDPEQPVLSMAVARLRGAGVLVVAASGNERKGDAMAAPACVDAVVSVGATYDTVLGREPDTGTYPGGCFDAETDAGMVSCFSNADSTLDLLAPGVRIRAAGTANRVAERRGTSQAAPHVSAVAALMLEQDPLLGPDDLEAILERTGQPTLDPKNGLSTPRLDARAAVEDTFRTMCQRRDAGARCPLELACDGGRCPDEGTCFTGQCVILLDATAELPADGCPELGVGTAALGVVGLARARRRRHRS